MHFFDYSSTFNNLTVISLFTVILVYFYLKTVYNYWAKKGVPHVCPTSLIFGNAKNVALERECSAVLYDKVYRQFKGEPYCGLYEFHYPILIVRDPVLIQQVLVEKFNFFHDTKMSQGVNPKGDELRHLNPFVLKGNEWKEIRSMMVAGFKSNRLRLLEYIMKQANQDIKKFLKEHPEDVDTLDLASRFASEMVANFGWGIQSNGFSKNSTIKQMFDSPDFASTKTIILFLFHPFLSYWLRLRVFNHEFSKFLQNITEQSINKLKANETNQTTLLQSIISAREKYSKNGKDMSITKVTAYLTAFYLDGYETVSRMLSYTLYCLMLHQNVQQRLREEITSFAEEDITIDQVNKLEYMDMVISEVGRMHAPLPHLGRICTESCKLGALQVEVGTRIIIPSYSIHHDPEYYPNPETFNPENFSEENKSKRQKFTHFLFGQGPRICLGLKYATANLKLFLYYLLKEYEILPPIDHPANPIRNDPHSPFIYVSKEKLYVTFKKIETQYNF